MIEESLFSTDHWYRCYQKQCKIRKQLTWYMIKYMIQCRSLPVPI